METLLSLNWRLSLKNLTRACCFAVRYLNYSELAFSSSIVSVELRQWDFEDYRSGGVSLVTTQTLLSWEI
jgi:hypothetical protein